MKEFKPKEKKLTKATSEYAHKQMLMKLRQQYKENPTEENMKRLKRLEEKYLLPGGDNPKRTK